MRARVVLLGIIMCVAILQNPPRASASQFVTVGTMVENCGSDRTSAAWGDCVGYVSAITDQMASRGFPVDGTRPRPNEAICPDADNDDFTITVPLFVTWA